MVVIAYLLGLLILAAWLRVKHRLRALFGLWALGLLLLIIRLSSQAADTATIAELSARSGAFPWLLGVSSWAGALILLRALLGLALWERPVGRRLWIFAGLFLLALCSPLLPGGGAYLLIVGLPLIWSFRWHSALSRKALFFIHVGALFSILATISGADPLANDVSGFLRGFYLFRGGILPFALIYALLSGPISMRRMSLTIQRIWLRLVSSHLLAGVVPVVLVALFLLLSAALYLGAFRATLGERILLQRADAAETEILRAFNMSGELTALPFGPGCANQLVFERAPDGRWRSLGAEGRFSPDSLATAGVLRSQAPFLWDGRVLYLRATVDTVLADRALRIEAFAPLDSLLMIGISEVADAPVALMPFVTVDQDERGMSLSFSSDSLAGASDSAGVTPLRRWIGDIGPRAWRLPGGAMPECIKATPTGWVIDNILVYSSSRFGEELSALVRIARESPIVTMAVILLGLIALFFLIAIIGTIAMVLSMGRSVTRAVRALTRATGALQVGEMDYRIDVEGKDELWSVATSFNRMAAQLEQVREIELEQERLGEELRLAREIQNRLLPAGPPTVAGLDLAGLSLPAREVGGDYFDFLPLKNGHLAFTIADVSGKGAPAALLMSAFRASLRSQDLDILGPAEALRRVNRFIHSSVDPGKFITAFLGVLDPNSGELRYANAGHDAPFLLRPDGSLESLEGGGLVLGVMPAAAYTEGRAHLTAETILAVFTDGVTEAQDPAGAFFELEGVARVLRESLGQSCAETIQRMVSEIETFAGSGPQADDITMIVAKLVNSR